MNDITVVEIVAFLAKGYVISVYPRKHMICVNGFKYYRAGAAEILAARKSR